MIPKDFKTDVTLSRRIGDYKEAQSMLYDDHSIRVVLEPHKGSSMEPKMRIKFDKKTCRHKRHSVEEHSSSTQTAAFRFATNGGVSLSEREYFDAE